METPLIESGTELIERIRKAIILRRPVLVTGPRGSGKSYCARRAIELAVQANEVGGMRFLQGNREIPREYLSEDMLVARDADGAASITLAPALATRHPTLDDVELKKRRSGDYPDWPALPTSKTPPGTGKPGSWNDGDWTVLFLDEINRFGEGFLDSLLSLTEERTVVRAGDEIHVPITVVATANPPGYDVTAKKLSPPLQARMARSYRVAQPTLEALSLVILPSIVKRAAEQLDCPEPPRPFVQLAAAICLCLWGAPSADRKGIGFLTPSTIGLLQEASSMNATLGSHMEELGTLIAFGPDARSVGDWLGAAMGAAGKANIDDVHLTDTAVETLAHKLRETFNEGVEPLKAARVGQLVKLVTQTVLGSRRLRGLFTPAYDGAAQVLLKEPGSGYEVYIFARCFSAVSLRPVVAGLAGATDDDEAVRALTDLRAFVALVQLERDLRRYAVASEDDTVAVRADRVREIRARVGAAAVNTTTTLPAIQELLPLPPHVLQSVVRGLSRSNLAGVHVAIELGRRCLPTGMVPPRRGLAYQLTPLLTDIWRTLSRGNEAPSADDWSQVARALGDVEAVEAVRTAAETLASELQADAAADFWARVRQLSRS